MRKFLLILVLVLGIVAWVVAPVSASPLLDKSVVWERFDVDVTVQTNGDLKVIETQQIKFQGGPFREGFATIPLKNSDGITDVAVTETGGRTYRAAASGDYTFSADRNDNQIEIVWRFPAISNQSRTFQFSYTVKGAIRQYAAGDKVQYMAVPTELEYAVYASTVKIHLPAPLKVDPDFAGPAAKWQISPDSKMVTFTLQDAVYPQQGFQFGLVFEHGAITAPIPAWQAAYDEQDNYERNVKPLIDLGLGALGLMLLLAVPAVLYLIWFVFGRDPSVGLVPEYITEPPSDIPAGLVGVLVDERADMRDITATMIDLARRGYLTLEEQEAKGAFGSTSKRFMVKKSKNAGGMNSYEAELYNALFGRGDEVDLNKLPEAFFTRLANIERNLYNEAVKAQLFTAAPDQVRATYTSFGVTMIGFLFLGSTTLFAILDSPPASLLCLLAPLGLFGIGLAILGSYMPKKTRLGSTQAARWKAFQTYLGNIQKYKDVKEATDQFEKYLPYAVAFGLERRWINAFAAEPTVPAPMWYRPLYYGRPLHGGMPLAASGGTPAPQMPNMNQMGEGMIGGLNQMGDGMINALNTAGRSFSTPPAPKYSGGGSSGSRSGGGFRSGGFSGGGFSGGGSRGFR